MLPLCCWGCKVDQECRNGGTCLLPDGTCVCNEKFGADDCSYRLRSKLSTFLISFFVGWLGVDRFYLGFVGIGVAKLILLVFAAMMGCIFCCCVWKTDSFCSPLPMTASVIWGMAGLSTFIFWLVDWMLILTIEQTKDANGYPLYVDF